MTVEWKKLAYYEQDLATSATPTFAGLTLSPWELGTATYKTLNDWFSTIQSSGRISGMVLTAHTAGGADGSLDISAGTGIIKTSEAVNAATKFFDYPGGNVVPTDNKLNYIYLDYDGGSLTVKATTDRSIIHNYDQFTIGRCYREATDASDITTSGTNVYNGYRRIHNMLVKRFGFAWASGSTVSEAGTRGLAVTGGTWFIGNTEITTLIHNTISGDGSPYGFDLYYFNPTSGLWVVSTGHTTLGNSQYNNVSTGTGLASIGGNKYANYWIYLCPAGDIYVLYGQATYNTLAEAQATQSPASLPDYISSNTRLIARLTIKNGATNFAAISNALVKDIPSGVATNHNQLAGLQGGIVDEYYHLPVPVQGYIAYANTTPAWTGLALGAAGAYLAGASGGSAVPTWQTLQQSVVAGLTTSDAPYFAGLNLTGNVSFTNAADNYAGVNATAAGTPGKSLYIQAGSTTGGGGGTTSFAGGSLVLTGGCGTGTTDAPIYLMTGTPYAANTTLCTTETTDGVGNPATAGRVFTAPIDCTGLDKATDFLKIDLKCDAAITSGQLELTSSGTSDSEEWNIDLEPFLTCDGAYHTYYLPLSSFSEGGGAPVVSQLDFIRAYAFFASGNHQIWWKNAYILYKFRTLQTLSTKVTVHGNGNVDFTGCVGIGTIAPTTSVTLITAAKVFTVAATTSRYQGMSLTPTFACPAGGPASAKVHTVLTATGVFTGTAWGASSGITAISASNYTIFTEDVGGTNFTCTGVSSIGLSAYGASMYVYSATGVLAQGVSISASGAYVTSHSTAIYIVNDTDHSAATPRQFGLYVEKPTRATANYQVALAGSGAGSGVWLNAAAQTAAQTNYVRVYASAASALAVDIDVSGSPTTVLTLSSAGNLVLTGSIQAASYVGLPAVTYSRSFIITNPTTASDGPIWRVPVAITITAVHVLVVGGTNIIGQLWEYDANGANGATVDSADITGLTTNVNDDGTLSNAGIAANNYLGWKTTSVSGAVTQAIITFEYTLA